MKKIKPRHAIHFRRLTETAACFCVLLFLPICQRFTTDDEKNTLLRALRALRGLFGVAMFPATLQNEIHERIQSDYKPQPHSND